MPDRPELGVGAGPDLLGARTEFGFMRSALLWVYVLVIGALVTALVAVATAATNDTILVPTLLIVGSFFVPVAMVAFALTRRREGTLTGDAILLGFLGGGTIGVLASAWTEVEVLPHVVGTFLAVGFIEEGAKAIVVALIAIGLHRRGARDGMVLGATVGAGFAGFESTGYALQALMDHTKDHAVLNIVGTEASRAVLAPFGHILWTALVGGALFAAAPEGRLRVTRAVVGTFAGVVLLHAAWDASTGWAIVVAEGMAGPGWEYEWPNVAAWIGTPTGDEAAVFDVAYSLAVGLNAAIATVWLVRRYRRYGRDEGLIG